MFDIETLMIYTTYINVLSINAYIRINVSCIVIPWTYMDCIVIKSMHMLELEAAVTIL